MWDDAEAIQNRQWKLQIQRKDTKEAAALSQASASYASLEKLAWLKGEAAISYNVFDILLTFNNIQD